MKKLHRLMSMVAAIAVAVSLLGPVATLAAPAHAGFQGTITMYANTYNPPAHNVPTAPGQVALNHTAMAKLAHEWEKAHPGVQIKFVDFSVGANQNYYTVLQTRLAGGTAPDIFTVQAFGSPGYHVDTFLKGGQIVDLTPFLMKPNKYSPGSRVWLSTFLAPYAQYARTVSGQYGTIPQDIVATGVYYNESLTQRAGLKLPPATWADFMHDLGKMKDAGFSPFGEGCCLVGRDSWFWNSVPSVTMHADIPKFAVLKYHPDYIPNVITTEDWVRAITKLGWRPSTDHCFVETTHIFKDWSQYWIPGSTSPNLGNPGQLFATGKLPFYWSGTWEVPGFRAQKLTFKYNTFWIPPITQQTTKCAPTQPVQIPGPGGYGSTAYSVNASLAKDNAKLALTIDWLQFITTAKHDEQIVNELPGLLPAVVGAKGDASLQPMFASVAPLGKTGGYWPAMPTMSVLSYASQDTWARYTTLYIQGVTSEADYFKQLDDLFAKEAQTLIAQNDKTKSKTGSWDLTKW